MDQLRSGVLLWVSTLQDAAKHCIANLYNRTAELEVFVTSIGPASYALAKASLLHGTKTATLTTAQKVMGFREMVHAHSGHVQASVEEAIVQVEHAEGLLNSILLKSKKIANMQVQSSVLLLAAQNEACTAREQTAALGRLLELRKTEIDELSTQLERQQVELAKLQNATIVSVATAAAEKAGLEIAQVKVGQQSNSIWEETQRAAFEEAAAARGRALRAEEALARANVLRSAAEEDSQLLRERIRRVGDEADSRLQLMQVT